MVSEDRGHVGGLLHCILDVGFNRIAAVPGHLHDDILRSVRSCQSLHP